MLRLIERIYRQLDIAVVVSTHILEDVERFQPGTEGNVYLLDDEEPPTSLGSRGAAASGAR